MKAGNARAETCRARLVAAAKPMQLYCSEANKGVN